MKKNVAAIILAAGKGKRMKSALPKVLHPLCARPMFSYVLDLARGLKIKDVVAVLGFKHERVRPFLTSGVKAIIQKQLLGTADAVRQALPALPSGIKTILILYGDIPLLKKESIEKLLKYHLENNPDATILTARVEKPSGYGRILRDKYYSIRGILEEKDADDFQKEIKEINTGIICFKKERLSAAIRQIRLNPRKKEYYLTDAIEILYKQGCLVDSVNITDIDEAMGINSRIDLARADRIMRRRINERLMKGGVDIIDPDSTFIGYGVKIGRDTVIYPFTVIERGVKIGKRCFVGPFIHLREGTNLADEVTAGNFLEVVRSRISAKTLIKHFSYVGDSRIGKAVNIGAGTVTANFDGKNKNITVIKDGAFIGSDTILVAPVNIGRQAVTGAGSVVTRGQKVCDGGIVAGVPARLIKKTDK